MKSFESAMIEDVKLAPARMREMNMLIVVDDGRSKRWNRILGL